VGVGWVGVGESSSACPRRQSSSAATGKSDEERKTHRGGRQRRQIRDGPECSKIPVYKQKELVLGPYKLPTKAVVQL
jgi:hypothetical protein